MIVDGWFHEEGELWEGVISSMEVKQVLDHHRSQYQDILVFESTSYGKVLVLDDVLQCSDQDEFSYHEMIAHIPLFSHSEPKRVLVIGGGDGGVVREVAKHPSVEEIVHCEIDMDVIEASKKHFPELSKGFDDPRLKLQITDGIKFLETNKDLFDVIITDCSAPIGPSVALFEPQYYDLMYANLRDGGIVCAQGECIWFLLDVVGPLVQAISKRFSTVEFATAYVPLYGQTGFIFATKGREKCSIPARQVSPEMEAELKYYTSELHSAAFVLPAFVQRAVAKSEI